MMQIHDKEWYYCTEPLLIYNNICDVYLYDFDLNIRKYDYRALYKNAYLNELILQLDITNDEKYSWHHPIEDKNIFYLIVEEHTATFLTLKYALDFKKYYGNEMLPN